MEQLMYHLWKFRLFQQTDLYTTEGIPFEIIDPGIRNFNAGPDFFNAKLRIDNTLWAGNVEIHQASSDWFRHGHHTDKNYDNVILNVISKHDASISRTTGETIRQFVMPVSAGVLSDYEYLRSRPEQDIPCAFRFHELNPLQLADWKNALVTERIISRSERIRNLTMRYQGNWEEAFYIILSRSFGTGVNSDAFERLARSVPFNYLLKHSDSLLQIEAMLFGQAGFLETPAEGAYYESLQREYQLLRTKFSLNPLPVTMWRFFRLRPNAFPQVRIALLALLIHTHRRLLPIFLNASSLDELRELFRLETSDFWRTHYQFQTVSGKVRIRYPGAPLVDSILINTLIPFLFAYGEAMGNFHLEEKAFDFLLQIRAEDNRYVRLWRSTGIGVDSAFDSQALIQLQKEYCDRRKCLYCRIGHQLLLKSAGRDVSIPTDQTDPTS